jgi:hypothetical protein
MPLVLAILAAFAAVLAYAGYDYCATYRADFQYQPVMLSLDLYQVTEMANIPREYKLIKNPYPCCNAGFA